MMASSMMLTALVLSTYTSPMADKEAQQQQQQRQQQQQQEQQEQLLQREQQDRHAGEQEEAHDDVDDAAAHASEHPTHGDADDASSAARTQDDARTLEERRVSALERRNKHHKRVREKLFETFCSFRLLVGFPVWHVLVRLLTYWTVQHTGFREDFAFRISVLLSILASWNYTSIVLRHMLPIFLVNYSWLIGGNNFTAVVFFPWDLLWRSFDCCVLWLTGRSVVRGVILRIMLELIEPYNLDISEIVMTQPTCHDDAFAPAYAAVYPDSPHLVPEDAGDCLSLTQAELFNLVFSAYGAFRIVMFVILIVVLRRLDAWRIFCKWWRDRENTIEELEKVLANRDKVLQYAKRNPFRAKLHADPRAFLATKREDNAETGDGESPTTSNGPNGFNGPNAAASGNSLSASLQRWTPRVRDLGIKSSIMRMRQWKPSTSLHARLGERAKNSTHVERIEALRKQVVEIHGVPDAYDLLFRKVDLRIVRGVDKSGRGVFLQVAAQLLAFPMKKLKNGFCVTFEGESGVDGGGLTAEMYKLVAEELSQLLPEKEPAKSASSNDVETPDDGTGTTAHRQSVVAPTSATALRTHPHILRALPDSTLMLAANPNLELVHYYALGKLVGLAIVQEGVFQLPLSSAMLKMMVDLEIDSEDVRAIDPVYFENRMLTLLQQGGVDLMKNVMDVEQIPFVWLDSNGEFGEELCANGAQRMLSEENKLEYIQLLSEQYVCGEVREEMQIFLSGFHEVIPVNALQDNNIDYIDLALALQGVPEIDVDDWKMHTLPPSSNDTWRPAQGRGAVAEVDTDQLLTWFWQVVREMDSEHRARLLQFSTGLSSTPVGGFRNLKPRPFNIVVDLHPDHLPSAVTCFNTLRVPACDSKEDLKKRLLKICSQRHLLETFGEK
ncbi:E3 ubiquitin-protein ligase RSP5 [Hondaea fermentalgiana]|uniref:HECT-type E3 ubiquitin transferase n=1 Tax=Hondaea fermentalgiana TaxID=2315210 RepID=A0A2R5GYV7_9STRA|nr:E3 ubiquitin-protein ligase RSP5 [Hondaea fermentalgiana]|eukprot:GBG33651.1 E3 ubiquitin-protein ligase RSP5 [Hondaea fermentalgiana]